MEEDKEFLIDDFSETDKELSLSDEDCPDCGEDHFSPTLIDHHYSFLTKNNLIAILSVRFYSNGTSILSQQGPRKDTPIKSVVNTFGKAKKLYRKSVNDSIANGWTVTHEGRALLDGGFIN